MSVPPLPAPPRSPAQRWFLAPAEMSLSSGGFGEGNATGPSLCRSEQTAVASKLPPGLCLCETVSWRELVALTETGSTPVRTPTAGEAATHARSDRATTRRNVGKANRLILERLAALHFHQALVRQFRRREWSFFLLVTVSSPIVRRRGLKVTNRTSTGFGAFGSHGRAVGLFPAAVCF
jgi:hypothetical protein